MDNGQITNPGVLPEEKGFPTPGVGNLAPSVNPDANSLNTNLFPEQSQRDPRAIGGVAIDPAEIPTFGTPEFAPAPAPDFNTEPPLGVIQDLEPAPTKTESTPEIDTSKFHAKKENEADISEEAVRETNNIIGDFNKNGDAAGLLDSIIAARKSYQSSFRHDGDRG